MMTFNDKNGGSSAPSEEKTYNRVSVVLSQNDSKWCSMMYGGKNNTYIYSKGINTAMRATRSIYAECIGELHGYFSPDEWAFLANLLHDKEFDAAEITNKAVLCGYIVDPYYNTLADYYQVNTNALAERIRTELNASHVFAIWMRVQQYWAYPEREEMIDWADL